MCFCKIWLVYYQKWWSFCGQKSEREGLTGAVAKSRTSKWQLNHKPHGNMLMSVRAVMPNTLAPVSSSRPWKHLRAQRTVENGGQRSQSRSITVLEMNRVICVCERSSSSQRKYPALNISNNESSIRSRETGFKSSPHDPENTRRNLVPKTDVCARHGQSGMLSTRLH